MGFSTLVLGMGYDQPRNSVKQILNDKKEVIFEGDEKEMTLAFNYLTKPFYVLAETMGLRMNDAYELNKKYWNDETKNAKSFELVDA